MPQLIYRARYTLGRYNWLRVEIDVNTFGSTDVRVLTWDDKPATCFSLGLLHEAGVIAHRFQREHKQWLKQLAADALKADLEEGVA